MYNVIKLLCLLIFLAQPALADIVNSDITPPLHHNLSNRPNMIIFCIWCLLSLTMISASLCVLIRKKPLLFPSKWFFVIGGMTIAAPLITIVDQGFDSLGIIISLIYVIMLCAQWKLTYGYALFGIKYQPCKQALRDTLDEMHFTYSEDIFLFHISSTVPPMPLAIESWAGGVQLKNKSKLNSEIFESIIADLKTRLLNNGPGINKVVVLWYMVLGLFLLSIAMFYANRL